jgi:hypothetical protein
MNGRCQLALCQREDKDMRKLSCADKVSVALIVGVAQVTDVVSQQLLGDTSKDLVI